MRGAVNMSVVHHSCGPIQNVWGMNIIKVIAQDESALPLTSTGPGSTNLLVCFALRNGLRRGIIMLPHV